MLIWGTRTKTITLGQLAYHCSRCGKNTVHTAFVQRRKFTLFFIPIFPIGTKHGICCNLCGLRLNAVADLQQQLIDWERTGQLQVPAASH